MQITSEAVSTFAARLPGPSLKMSVPWALKLQDQRFGPPRSTPRWATSWATSPDGLVKWAWMCVRPRREHSRQIGTASRK